MQIRTELFKLKDEKYKDFHAKLIPSVEKDLIIGVRTPILRAFAKTLPEDESFAFLQHLPHKYYEENNLHAFLIEKIDDFDKAVCETKRFLPYVDNWATCDMFFPKIFKKNTNRLMPFIDDCLNSKQTYTVRYGICLLMKLYLEENTFEKQYLDKVSKIKSDEYYVNMMIAWYFATALSKQYDCALSYLTDGKLDKWVHNKTIQKACESRLINSETKIMLKTLRV